MSFGGTDRLSQTDEIKQVNVIIVLQGSKTIDTIIINML